MINKHMDIPHLFHGLRYIVIDELHSFLRSDRGGQTFCLIERLSKLADVHPRRIGLSATIGNISAASKFLGAGSDYQTVAPKVNSTGQVWRLSMEHFYKTDPQASADNFDPAQLIGPKTDQAPELADPGIGTFLNILGVKKSV